MNNREWLYSLDVADLADWFDSEHVETPNATSHGDTAALDAKYDDDSREKLEADVRVFSHHMYTSGEMYHKTLAFLDRQAAITEARCDREFEAACNSCALKIDLLEEVDRLTAELDSARRERETYRELLGKAIDFAFDITLLLDEGAA